MSDIAIEHSGKKVWYTLAKEESGLAYHYSLAPELAPQVNQSNYSYGSIPPQIAVIRAFEDWHQGAGYTEGEETPDHAGHGGHRYSHSRYVEASHGGLRKSPAIQALLESDATAIAAAPDFYSRTSDGVFLVAGTVLYEYVSAAWLSRKTLAGAGTGPVVDFNGTGFVPTGDSAAYAYSADGVTWTTVTTLADLSAHKFVVRGQSSGAAILWKITSTGALKNNTSGESAGAAWSAATQMGSTGDAVNSLLVMDGDLVVFKTDGIHTYDGTVASTVWSGGRLMYASNNGANAVVWSDGCAYTTYGNALCKYDNVNTEVSFPWPTADMRGNSEINGQITALAADVFHIYFALKNAAGNTYIMKGHPDRGFHTWAYLGANDCDALLVAGAGDVHASNPTLLIGYSTAGDYIILPRTGLLPEDDSNYRFDTTDGYIIGGLDGANTKGFTKFLNAGIVLGKNLATGRTAELLYEADESGTYVSVLTADTDGKTEKPVAATVEYSRLRYRASLTTTASTETPVVDALVFSVSPNTPRKQLWEVTVDLSAAPNGDSRVSAIQQLNHLRDGKNERCYLYDLLGEKHRVRILDIKGVQAEKTTAAIKQKLSLVMVEV